MRKHHLFNYKDYGRLWRVYGRSALTGTTFKRLSNALRTEYAYRRRRMDVSSRPYVLFIEPLYYCNLRCPLCPRETSPEARKGREAGRLPDDLISQVFDELGDYLYQCHIFGNGEPMLDWQRTRAIVDAARKRKVFTLVSTNCTIMNPDTARDVVTSGLNYLVCAIDGISQESYHRYRVGGKVDVALAGMRMLVDAKRATNGKIHLEWQFLVHAHNIHEVEQAKKLAADLGVFFRPSPLGGLADAELARQWLPETQWRDNAPQSKPKRDFPCYWLWRAIVVNSNGQLGRCPGESNVHQLGEFRGKSIMSIYNGPTTQRARQLFSKHSVPPGDFPVPCATCNYYHRHHGPQRPGESEPLNGATAASSRLSLVVTNSTSAGFDPGK